MKLQKGSLPKFPVKKSKAVVKLFERPERKSEERQDP
jgi:hypothetical protein